MIQPDLDTILKKVDCRYTLVMEVARRARQIVDGSEPLTDKPESNPVSQAVVEVYTDKITYIRKDDEK